MKAFRCDRCEKYFDAKGHHRGTEIKSQWLLSHLRTAWYPANVDVCFDCAEPLREFLAQWWAEESDHAGI